MNVLIACDSFKGTFSSEQIALTIKKAIIDKIPDATVDYLPISDGGEGIIDCFYKIIGGEKIRITVTDPNFLPTEAEFLLCGDVAVIETAQAADIFAAWFPIFYAGVLSTGVAFTLQIVGQREADPAPAAVIMSLESLFGALAGWLVLGEILSSREIAGCVLMGVGMLVSQAGGYAIEMWKKRR